MTSRENTSGLGSGSGQRKPSATGTNSRAFRTCGFFCWLKNPKKQTTQTNHPSCKYSSLLTHTWVFWTAERFGLGYTSSLCFCEEHSLRGVLGLTCLYSLCFVAVLPLAAKVQSCSPLSVFDLLVFISALPGAGWDLLQKGKSAKWSIFYQFLSLTDKGKYWHSFKKSHSCDYLSLPWKFRLTARFKEKGLTDSSLQIYVRQTGEEVYTRLKVNYFVCRCQKIQGKK